MPNPHNAGAGGDAAERATSLDTARSFIVQAPAGSGKTELLLQRYLALLALVAQPEAIVAMTFTRKAAGEIRDRILSALREAAGQAPADANRALTWRLARSVLERDAARGWNLLAHPARMQVHTIDALCVTLMRRAPLAVRLGALPRLTEHAEHLYAEAARAELNAAHGADESWLRLLSYLDNDADRLVGLIAGLLGKREQWLRHLVKADAAALRGALESALVAEIDAELAALAVLLPRGAARSLARLARYAARNLERDGATHPLGSLPGEDELPPAKSAWLAHWRAIADWLLTKKGSLRRKVATAQGFPGREGAASRAVERETTKWEMEALLESLAAIPGLPAALHFVRTLPPSRYEDAAWSFIEALLSVLPRVAARLNVVFAQADAIDFGAATLITLDALSSDAPSDLLLSLDARIEHLLVDEFQDTSLAQYELIEALTAGWAPGDGRTLFVVGDPMQSIYRFRDAEVSLYLDAQRRGRIGCVALEPLTLSCNFRSQRGLVDWVNDVYLSLPAARARSGRGAVAFSAAIATRGPGAEAPVTLDLSADATAEAAAVVARVRAALATDAEDIAILVRWRNDLAEILPALRGAGIAYAAVELDRLSERQAVLDIVSLAHALLQPDDRAAWLATLRAPWCALTLPDLFAVVETCADGSRLCEVVVAGARRDAAAGRLSAEGRLRFERFAAVVAPALAQRGRVPAATMLRGVWLALGGPACVAEPIDLAAAERVFALFAEHAQGADVPDWPAFTAALNALYAKPDTDAATRVRVMTLHRAKGLEFDVVVMPGLARRPPTPEAQLLLWRERSAGLLLAPIRGRALGATDNDPVYAYLSALAAAENEAELDRLLYVGCTRARAQLHLTATLDTDDTGAAAWKAPPRGSSLAALWPALSRLAGAPTDLPRATRSSGAARGVPLKRLPLSWQLPPPPALALAPAPDLRAPGEAVEFDWVRETARTIGTLAHRLLRRIGEEGVECWSADRLAAERTRIERELVALGFTAAEASAAGEQVLSAIKTTLSDARGRWLFDPAHADPHSEWALTQWREGAFVHRVLDRSFVAGDGTRWIVDFKLSRHEGADVEGFLDNERERYRAQLEAYAELMRTLDARPVRLGLYFPLLAGWREWAAPD